MPTITVPEADARLPELIDRVNAGDEVIITRDAMPIAKLSATPTPTVTTGRRIPGLLKGLITIHADDDEHLADFSEYM